MMTVVLAAVLLAAGTPAPAAVDAFYWRLQPPVVAADGAGGATLTVRCPVLPDAVTFEPADGSAPRPLTPLAPDTWSIPLSHADLLFEYLPDDVNRNFVGRVRVAAAGSPDMLVAVFVNVTDAAIPKVGVRVLAPDVQCSPHVVNVTLPLADPLGTTSSEEFLLRRQAVRRFYENFADRYDMVNVVLTLPRITDNRTHVPLKNDVQGIGMALFDNSGSYGSAGRLRGLNQFPLDTVFDLAETGAVHEIGHQWINHLTEPLLAPGRPHWPPSEMARGVMGFSIPPGIQGGTFSYAFVPMGGGMYLVQQAPPTREFHALDLYLMGLLPPADVPPYVVAAVPYGEIVHGAIVPGTVGTVDDVIAVQGPRVPPAASPMVLRVATIVISRERRLTRAEMAFFDYFAARGESPVPLPFASGFEKGITRPFALATRGLATLQTDIDCPLPPTGPR